MKYIIETTVDTITNHCLKKLMRSLTASLLVPLTI